MSIGVQKLSLASPHWFRFTLYIDFPPGWLLGQCNRLRPSPHFLLLRFERVIE